MLLVCFPAAAAQYWLCFPHAAFGRAALCPFTGLPGLLLMCAGEEEGQEPPQALAFPRVLPVLHGWHGTGAALECAPLRKMKVVRGSFVGPWLFD